jgi:hypothetical protein
MRVNNRNPPDDIEAWAAHVAELYPQVERVVLCGLDGPDAGVDVGILFRESVYAEPGGEAYRLEQRIAFDPEVRCDGLDLYFVRPRAELGYWAWPPGEPPDWLTRERNDYLRDCLLAGHVVGDFGRFCHDLQNAVVLFDRRPLACAGAPE